MLRFGPKLVHVPQNQTRLEVLLAEEILAEAARKGLKHNVIQREAGVLPRAWGRYFVQRERTIPLDVVTAVAAVLGLPASVLMRRAEERLAEESGPVVTLVTRDAPPRPPAIPLDAAARRVTRSSTAKAARDRQDADAES